MHRKQSKKRVVLGIAIAVAVIAAFGTCLYMMEHIFDGGEEDVGEAEDATILYVGNKEMEITHSIESYLMIGTDDSGNVEAEGTDEYRGQMADFLLLYIMDKTAGTYGFLQIDRNTMTDVPVIDTEGNGIEEIFEQICTANWYGGKPEHGCSNTVYTVGELVGGLEIDGYYQIHMSDIGTLNHAVGGVEVTLDEDFSDKDPAMTKGKTLTLNDKQAEIFVRGRMDVGGGTNEERMSRQMAYMQGYKAKAKTLLGEDSNFANDLYQAMEKTAVTDLPENRLSVMANQIYKGEDLGILTIDGETKLGKTLGDGVEHEEFYADEGSIADAMITLCGIDKAHITEDTGEDE